MSQTPAGPGLDPHLDSRADVAAADRPAPTEQRSALGGLGRFLRRFRAPLVILPLFAGLVVAGSVGAHLMRRDAATSAPPGPVTCWNGAVRVRSACGRPTGVLGLQWVFPAFRPHGGRCHAVGRRAVQGPSPTVWACPADVRGQAVTVTYAERTGTQQGLAQIRSQYDTRPTSVRGGERLLWRAVPSPGQDGYVLSEAYARFPYSVTVTGPSTAIVDQALTDLVRFRKADTIIAQAARPS